MATIKVEGIAEYIELLEMTERQTKTMVRRTIYPGAKIVYKEVRGTLGNVQKDNSLVFFHGKLKEGQRTGPTAAQLAGLVESLGIAPMKEFGSETNTKVGFDGYNPRVKTKKYPNGQPNMLIARSINSGTSYFTKQPFMDTAVITAKPKAEDAMEKQFDKELEKYWNKAKL